MSHCILKGLININNWNSLPIGAREMLTDKKASVAMYQPSKIAIVSNTLKTERPNYTLTSGERMVKTYLDYHSIKYVTQVSLGCKDVNPLLYDFVLPECRTIIEYDGVQHVKPISMFDGSHGYNNRVKHDKIKDNYATSIGYSVIRVSYKCNTQSKVNTELNKYNFEVT